MVFLKCLTLPLVLMARHSVWKKQEWGGHTTSPRTKTLQPVLQINDLVFQIHDIESCRSVLVGSIPEHV